MSLNVNWVVQDWAVEGHVDHPNAEGHDQVCGGLDWISVTIKMQFRGPTVDFAN